MFVAVACGMGASLVGSIIKTVRLLETHRMGYAFGTIDELGDGVFRKVRQELGGKAFGVNVLVIPSGVAARPHYHEVPYELEFMHGGRAALGLPAETPARGPGGPRPP